MSTIPDYRQLKRDIPQVSGEISSAGAGANIGKGLMDVARVTAGIKQAGDASEYAKAASLMSTGLIGEKNAYTDREDYTTFDDEYQGNTETMLGEHAKSISNPAMRDKFINEFRPRMAAGREQLSNVAWTKEKDFEKGELDTATDTSVDAFVLSGDDEERAMVSGNAIGLIQSHFDMGWIDETERKERTETLKHDMAISLLESKAPEKRVEMLKQPWAKNLPASTHAKLVRQSEEALIIGKAQESVDDFMAAGLDFGESTKELKKIKDPAIRKATEARRDYLYAKQEKEVSVDRTAIYDEWFLPLRMGEKSITDMPRDQLESLSPAQQSNLIQAQSSSVSKTKTPFNTKLEDEFNILLKTKRFTDLRKHYEENSASLSDAQNKSWSAVSIDGVVPAEIKPLFTEQSTLDSMTPTLTKEQRGPLKELLTEWHYDFQENNNRIPDAKEYKEKIDRMVMEYDVNEYFPWSENKRIADMSESDKEYILENAKEQEPELFKDLSEYYKTKGEQPDLETFMQQYTQIKEKRSGS